jgi:hypothetical protein
VEAASSFRGKFGVKRFYNTKKRGNSYLQGNSKKTRRGYTSPTDTSFHFLSGKIKFPSEITKYSDQAIDEKGDVWGMVTLKYDIDKYVVREFPAQKDYANVVQIGIPVIIWSYYTTKGRGYADVSLYQLRYQATIVEGKDQPLSAEFTGLLFMTHNRCRPRGPHKIAKRRYEANKDNR